MAQVTTVPLPEFRLWQRLANRHALLSFDLEITTRCNNNCRHCYINVPEGQGDARRIELSLAEVGDIADQAVRLGALWCLITGGEPLVREDFAEVYVALKARGLLISLFTNACLVNREHISLFKEYPPRDIEVTVYGVTEGTYERVTRRHGSYAAFRRGLDLLVGSGIKVHLKAMALRSNVHELVEIANFCREHTKHQFRFDPFPHMRYDGDAARNQEIQAERLSPAEIVAIEQADSERFGSLEKHCDGLILTNRCDRVGCDHLFHCGTGNQSCSVSYDGIFRLCADLCHPDCVYDLRKGTLAEAWTEFVPRVRQMRSSSREFLHKCHVCPIMNLCMWCPAHAHLETGRMDAWVEYFCQVAHARARALGWTGAHPRKARESP